MTEILPLSIGVGLAVSLLFTELFGIAAGGMIVPGYLALGITHPIDLVLTIGCSLLTFVIGHSLSSFLILYGRRRTVLMILIGYVVGMTVRSLVGGYASPGGVDEVHVIGYIIPGLIAIWLDRQGVVETLAALVTAAIVVRLFLVVVVDPELWLS